MYCIIVLCILKKIKSLRIPFVYDLLMPIDLIELNQLYLDRFLTTKPGTCLARVLPALLQFIRLDFEKKKTPKFVDFIHNIPCLLKKKALLKKLNFFCGP